jgi:hypothetical protein
MADAVYLHTNHLISISSPLASSIHDVVEAYNDELALDSSRSQQLPNGNQSSMFNMGMGTRSNDQV